jgi:hypothetical protein
LLLAQIDFDLRTLLQIVSDHLAVRPFFSDILR